MHGHQASIKQAHQRISTRINKNTMCISLKTFVDQSSSKDVWSFSPVQTPRSDFRSCALVFPSRPRTGTWRPSASPSTATGCRALSNLGKAFPGRWSKTPTSISARCSFTSLTSSSPGSTQVCFERVEWLLEGSRTQLVRWMQGDDFIFIIQKILFVSLLSFLKLIFVLAK